MCPWGKCPWGICPGGFCPVTVWVRACMLALCMYWSMYVGMFTYSECRLVVACDELYQVLLVQSRSVRYHTFLINLGRSLSLCLQSKKQTIKMMQVARKLHRVLYTKSIVGTRSLVITLHISESIVLEDQTWSTVIVH